MSLELDDAEVIRTRLMTAPNPALKELAVELDITAIDPVIDRQKDISTKIKAMVQKAGGISIVIEVDDYQNFTSGGGGVPRADLGYTLRVYGKDIIDQGQHPVTQVMKSVIRRLWHWTPRGGHSHGEVSIRGGGRIPHASMTIFELNFTIPTNL